MMPSTSVSSPLGIFSGCNVDMSVRNGTLRCMSTGDFPAKSCLKGTADGKKEKTVDSRSRFFVANRLNPALCKSPLLRVENKKRVDDGNGKPSRLAADGDEKRNPLYTVGREISDQKKVLYIFKIKTQCK